MKRGCVILGLLLFFAQICMASSWQGMEVDSYQVWHSLSNAERFIYIQGMVQGLKFRDGPLGPFEPVSSNFQEYINKIDSYYISAENELIPVILLFDLSNSVFNGLSEEEHLFRIESLREIVSHS